MIPFTVALLLLIVYWVFVSMLAMRETRMLRRRVQELEAELEATRKAGK